jgi:hypothetical protein
MSFQKAGLFPFSDDYVLLTKKITQIKRVMPGRWGTKHMNATFLVDFAKVCQSW